MSLRTNPGRIDFSPPQEARERGQAPVLELRDLSVRYETQGETIEAVRGVSLALARGETLGIVGESGCGKSSLAFAIMGYLGQTGRATGEIRLGGDDLLAMSDDELRRIRGSRLALVYQDPLSTLNPSLTIGAQIAEVYQAHRGLAPAAAWAQAVQMLGKVGIGGAAAVAARYPHQLSGGMQQRVVIAMALCCDPDVLILDEPTTALDVTTQARVLDLVNTLQREFRSAVLYISHNLGVIAQVCDRVAIMYAGQIVEEGSAERLFGDPRHPYNVGLLGCVPRLDASKSDAPLRPIPSGSARHPATLGHGCAFATRCELVQRACWTIPPALVEIAPDHRTRCHFSDDVPAWSARRLSDRAPQAGPSGTPRRIEPDERSQLRPLLTVQDLTTYYGASVGIGKLLADLLGRSARPTRAVDGITFDLAPGETLALVGESGCGKTTLGRSIVGLAEVTRGQMAFDGVDITHSADTRAPEVRREIQMVFQNPESSLNPSHTVGHALARPLKRFLGLSGPAAEERITALLEAVNLDPSYARRYPRQLSGGEKQRVAIARAFAGQPRLIVLDEPVSALDVSVQAAVLNLLADLQRERGTAYIFIGHDLGVVRYLADWVGVIYLGKLCEFGRVDELFQPPYHPYTEALLSAVPRPDPRVRPDRLRLDGFVPSPQDPPTGCPFHTRCPRKLGAICETIRPPARQVSPTHQIHCHIESAELLAVQATGGD